MQTTTELSISTLEQGFHLNGWAVAPQHHSLTHHKNRQTRHLEPRAMQVLLELARQPGEFITREQLLDSVWNTRFVSEDVLTGAIVALRKALNDDPKSPRYIETRRGVGYRLIVAPLALDDARHSRARWQWGVAAVLMTTLVAGILLIANGQPEIVPEKAEASTPTIAVLPFSDYSADAQHPHLADAVTESLIQKLAELQQFRVISRTSVMPYRDTGKSAAQIAAELGAHWFVEGSVMHETDQVRITAQLIDAADDKHLWSGQFDRPYADIFGLLDEVAAAVSMPVLNTTAADQFLPKNTAYNLTPDDLDNYLRARYLLSSEKPDDARRALQTFTRLSQQQPAFFGGFLGKAQALLLLFKQAQLDGNALDEALPAVQRALELNPQAAEAYRCRGQIVFFRDLDFPQAESDYLMGIALNSSDYVARRRYAWLLVAQQRYTEAAAQLAEIKRLDPVYYADAANALLMLYAGQTSAAINELERLRTASPDSIDIHNVLWRAYLAAGDRRQANQMMLEWLRLRGIEESRHSALQVLLAQNDDQAFYQSILDQQLLTSELHQAMLHVQLQQTSTAMSLIEKAWQQRNPAIAYLSVMPNLQPLHVQPRFRSLLSQLAATSKVHRLGAIP